MASLHKTPKNRSPYWYCSFVNADGRRSFKSTKATDHGDAMVICREWEHAAKLGRRQVLTEVQVRKVLGDIYERMGTGQKLHYDTVETFFKEWLIAKKEITATGTYSVYVRVLGLFQKHLGAKSKLQLNSLDARDFVSYRDAMIQKKKLSNDTINNHMGILRRVLNTARKQQKVLSNPAEAVDFLPDTSSKRGRFTREQITALLKVAEPRPQWKGAILISLYHALRLYDVAALTWGNIDLEKRIITYTPKKQRRCAVAKILIVPMHPDVEQHLLDLPIDGKEPTTPLFPTLIRSVVSGRVSGLSAQFARLMKRAGITRESTNSKTKRTDRKFFDLSFHSLRHTSISEQCDVGIAQDLRKKLCGHSSNSIHEDYNKPAMKTLRDAVDKIPSFLK